MMKKTRQKIQKREKTERNRIAISHVEKLLELTEKEVLKGDNNSKRYMDIAWDINKRFNLRCKELRRKRCKSCGNFLVPGKNCLLRLKDSAIELTCSACGNKIKLPYKE